MECKHRCIVLPIEADERYSVRGLIAEGYVRVQFKEDDFFIPANVFRKTAFDLDVGEHVEGRAISTERLDDTEDGAKRFRFSIRTRHGQVKRAVITGRLVDEIVERIDQVKALLHSYSYDDPEASAPFDAPDAIAAE